jgi:hypothetical protein
MTITEFPVKTADPDHYFDAILSIGLGDEVSLRHNQRRFVLGHRLLEMTVTHEGEDLTEKEVRARLDFLSGAEEGCQADISRIASHFHQLTIPDFDGLRPSILQRF